MKRYLYVNILFVQFLSTSIFGYYSHKPPQVAVIPFKDTRMIHKTVELPEKVTQVEVHRYFEEYKGYADAITEMLITALMKNPNIKIIDRNEFKKIDALTPETIELAKQVGLDAMILGAVSLLNGMIEIDCRLVRIPTGEFVASKHIQTKEVAKLREIVEKIATEVISVFIGPFLGEFEIQTEEDSMVYYRPIEVTPKYIPPAPEKINLQEYRFLAESPAVGKKGEKFNIVSPKLLRGDYEVVVTKKGRRKDIKLVRVAADTKTTYEAELPEEFSTIKLFSLPKDAVVLIKGLKDWNRDIHFKIQIDETTGKAKHKSLVKETAIYKKIIVDYIAEERTLILRNLLTGDYELFVMVHGISPAGRLQFASAGYKRNVVLEAEPYLWSLPSFAKKDTGAIIGFVKPLEVYVDRKTSPFAAKKVKKNL